jgi:hypothetical protein
MNNECLASGFARGFVAMLGSRLSAGQLCGHIGSGKGKG